MREVELMKFPALFVRRESPAVDALLRMLNADPPSPGSIYFVSDEEFASLKADAVALEL